MKLIFLLILSLILVADIHSQTSCDFILQATSTALNTYNTKGYNPLNGQYLYYLLGDIKVDLLTTYQLCLGKVIFDPDSLYPQDPPSCLSGMYNVSLLASKYSGQYARIKSQIDSIAKLIFSTHWSCRPIFGYKGWNFTDDCRGQVKPLDDLFNKYENDIIMGKSGLNYVNDMILQSERIRKLCGYNTLVKANTWRQDTCSAANNKWLYPLIDQMDTLLIQKKQTNFTQYFYHFYQSVYRVKSVCNVTLYEEPIVESDDLPNHPKRKSSLQKLN